MATFNLSILSVLEEKFNELKRQIDEKSELIEINKKKLEQLVKQIQELESQKLNIELDLGEQNKEKLKLEELYNTTHSQCVQVQESASKILSQF